MADIDAHTDRLLGRRDFEGKTLSGAFFQRGQGQRLRPGQRRGRTIVIYLSVLGGTAFMNRLIRTCLTWLMSITTCGRPDA